MKTPKVAKNAWGRGIRLEGGGSVAIFRAKPKGWYGLQIGTVPLENGEGQTGHVQVMMSNQAMAALCALLLGELSDGHLNEGLAKIPNKDEADKAGPGKWEKKR